MNFQAGPICAVIVGVAACALLSGCTNKVDLAMQQAAVRTPVVTTTPPERFIEVSVDEFTKETIYSGPETFTFGGSTEEVNSGADASLYASAKKGADTSYALRFYTLRTAPASKGYQIIESAIDTDSQSLPVILVQRSVECSRGQCDFTENGLISISRKYLQNHAQSGLRVRLNGQRGSQIVNIPASDVTEFLAKVPAA